MEHQVNYSDSKPGMLAAGQRTWFLKIDPVWIVGICVCVYVRAQGY